MEYPITLARDTNGTVLVSFVDFPEAHTFGDDIPDALRQAPDALATVIDAYIKDRRDLPLPSAVVTKYRVTVPALIEAKMRLYETMRTSKVGKSELAKRLKWHLPQVDRLLAMHHGSKLEQLESAFQVMGKRLVLGIEDVPQASESSRAARRCRPKGKTLRPRSTSRRRSSVQRGRVP